MISGTNSCRDFSRNGTSERADGLNYFRRICSNECLPKISIKYQIYTGQTELKVRSGTNFTTSVVVACLVLFLSIDVLIKQTAREKE